MMIPLGPNNGLGCGTLVVSGVCAVDTNHLYVDATSVVNSVQTWEVGGFTMVKL